jgi:hypothetical protein
MPVSLFSANTTDRRDWEFLRGRWMITGEKRPWYLFVHQILFENRNKIPNERERKIKEKTEYQSRKRRIKQ